LGCLGVLAIIVLVGPECASALHKKGVNL